MSIRNGRAVAVLLSVAMMTCSADATQPCSPDDMLKKLGEILRTGDTAQLGAITLRYEDLDAHPNDPSAAASFDAEVLEATRQAVLKVRQEYHPRSIRAVKIGTIERHVHVEGTEYFVDRINDSVIVIDDGTAEKPITVQALIRGRGCWRLEYLGTGAPGIAPPTPQKRDGGQRTRPTTTGFHRFADADYCSGVTVYSSPSHEHEIGTLVEGYRRYRDPKSDRVVEAVLLQSLATGHVRGIWMTRDQLRATYVDGADHALEDCKWSVREKEVTPLPSETPAQLSH